MTTPNKHPNVNASDATPHGGAAASNDQSKQASDQAVLEVLRKTRASMMRVRDKLSEPLAIIGVGCRFPQAAGPDEFWRLLSDGRCAISDTPSQRWSDTLKASHPKQKGKVTANCGGYISDVDQFDAGFFGISGREAAALDPQQRLMLEVAWETLEHAGIDPHSTRGSRTGVFAGICSNDYLQRLSQAGVSSIGNYHGAGNAHGAAAGRLNYFMNWNGPSTAVDTACSSSLTALHLAARSIRYGDCEMALVAGVNLILSPDLSISLSQAGMLSPTGLCHTFDAAADGFVRGEGCGAVLLKRLSAAVADNDRILCVVRGTACNQDGRSNGLTAPNGIAQEEVIRAALADARANPSDIDYIEAHGTGTSLGDPIEMAALQSVFARGRNADKPLRTGSVKTNIGHLEGAAGIAGVIKVALSLHHGQLPSHLHFNQPSPHIDWNWPVKTTADAQDWSRTNRPRLAGVSSFGFGGSNAHVVLAEAPSNTNLPLQAAGIPATPGAHVLAISARCDAAAREIAADYARALRDGADIPSLCSTAATGRAQFDCRIAVVGDDPQSMARQLEAAVPSQMQSPNGAMLLDANGQQPVNCESLYQRFEVFRDAFDAAAVAVNTAMLNSFGNGVTPQRLRTGAGLEKHEVRAQQFAVLYASGMMWQQFGVTPSKVLAARGAEHAAAAVSGLLSLQAAAGLLSHQLLVEHATGENHDDAVRRFSAVLAEIEFAGKHFYQAEVPGHVEPATAAYWTDVLEAATLSDVGVSHSSSLNGADKQSASIRLSVAGCADLQQVLQRLARLYCEGWKIQWRSIYPQRLTPVTAPVYRFQRKRHWFETADEMAGVQAEEAVVDGPVVAEALDAVHPLLGRQLDVAGAGKIFETDLSKLDYLQDHCVNGRVLFPATGYLELAVAAAHEMRDGLSVMEMQILRPVVLTSGEATRVQTSVFEKSGEYFCEISVRTARAWKTAAECKLKVAAPVNVQQRMAAGRNGHSSPVVVEHHYQQCQDVGLQYGPAFRGVVELFGAQGESWGVVKLPAGVRTDGYQFHPAALDACLQVAASAIGQHAGNGWVPVGIGHYEVCRKSVTGDLHVYVRTDAAATDSELSLCIVIHDADGQLIAAIDRLDLAALPSKQSNHSSEVASSNAPVEISRAEKTADTATGDTSGKVAAILAAEPAGRNGLLQTYLHGRVADIMGMTVEEIPAQTPLDSLGMDSMMAFELRDELERDFNLMVPMELFLQETSLEQFSQNVAQGLAKLDGQSSSAASVMHGEPDDDESWIEGAI